MSRVSRDHRGLRSLRKFHPDALSHHAPRARHLRYNHFTRPPRRRHLTEACDCTELLDGLSIKGGYDGTRIFFKLELDVSKEAMSDLRDVILKPILLLSETDFMQDLSNLFIDGASIVDSVFDNIEADISFSAGAHLGATGKYFYHYILVALLLVISNNTSLRSYLKCKCLHTINCAKREQSGLSYKERSSFRFLA